MFKDLKSTLTEVNWFKAIENEDLDIIKIFIENKFDVNIRNIKEDRNGFGGINTNALLMVCKSSSNFDIVKYLIKNRADINTQNQYDDDMAILLLRNTKFDNKIDIVKYIIDLGISDKSDCHGDTVLFRYLIEMFDYSGYDNDPVFEIVELLINAGAIINAPRWTLLNILGQQIADGGISEDNTREVMGNIMKLLIKHGAKFNENDLLDILRIN